jgi:hypothetical protein
MYGLCVLGGGGGTRRHAHSQQEWNCPPGQERPETVDTNRLVDTNRKHHQQLRLLQGKINGAPGAGEACQQYDMYLLNQTASKVQITGASCYFLRHIALVRPTYECISHKHACASSASAP